MAYAEKRGQGARPWRVRYRLPDGKEASESGFTTRTAALAWGRDQETTARENRRAAANPGKVTVSEWIDRWLAMQDVGPSTVEIREYLIRRFIRPAWAASELRSLTTEEITRWENAIPARTGVSRRVARDARSLLGTILRDAAAARPPLIPFNPALRPPNRGRRTGRRLERSPQRAWATPLQALLAAERAALLTGRDEDFTMVITIAYTGLRWGETIGLERGHVHQDEIHVEWQLREIRSRFHRLPPKGDSYRSPRWEPSLPVDLPPFLTGLISRQIQAQPRRRCVCAAQHGGSGHYVFLGPDGGHYRRSGYARRVFRPACDGRHKPGASQPARLIITDASAWPGIPVATWPAAQPGSAPFTPPRGRGIAAIPAGIPLACWLAVRQGLTPHGLRHSHKTWMAEDGIPEILAEQRLGHTVPGMRGLYSHVSDRMRDDLRYALQARWEDSLRARAAINSQSPVPLLDGLLAPFPAQDAAGVKPATLRLLQQAASRNARSPGPAGNSSMSTRAARASAHLLRSASRPGPEALPSVRAACRRGHTPWCRRGPIAGECVSANSSSSGPEGRSSSTGTPRACVISSAM